MRLVKNSHYKTDPFQTIESWFKPSFDEIFDWPALSQQAMKNFKVDLYEDAENYYVVAELPGIKKEEIEVSAEDKVITVSAVLNNKNDEVTRGESAVRSIQFDESVALDKTQAKYENGVLTLSVPKAMSSKLRQIAIA